MTHPFESIKPWGYEVVVADPAWTFKSNSAARPGRNPRRHYQTSQSLDEIKAWPVKDIVSDNAVLFLWITGPFLAIGAHVPVMKAWGFKPSGMGFVWIKLNPKAGKLFIMPQDIATGTGFTTRKSTAFCLIGKRGRSLRVDAGVQEAVIDNRREHSRKPDEVFERIERYVGPGRRMLELNARQQRIGWTCFGDEIGKFDRSAA